MDPYSTVTLTLMTQNLGLTTIAAVLAGVSCVFSYYAWQTSRSNRAQMRAQFELINRYQENAQQKLDTLTAELRQALDDARSDL